MDLIYLDNNATTQPAPEVVEAMLPYLTEWYGNPSSVHRFGQRSRQAIDEARSKVASLLNCNDSEILFTGGGTEAVNTALRSLLLTRLPRRKVITTTVEHSATRELLKELAKGSLRHTETHVDLVELPVDREGTLDLDRLRSQLDDETAFVSILWANNETGVLFPVHEIAQLCREKRVPFHCDGTQAVGKIPTDLKELAPDLFSFAPHKFHGPKGVGGLYVRSLRDGGLRLKPFVLGGPQETSRRGGTENVPGIVGMGKAAELAEAYLKEEGWRMKDESAALPASSFILPPSSFTRLRDRLEQGILRSIPDTSVNGTPSPERRLPNTTNIAFARLEAEAILLLLSEQGICASAGAACSSGSLEPSHVLRAMGIEEPIAHGAVRFSLSRYTTEAQIDRTLQILPPLIARLRAVLPVAGDR